MQSEPPSNQYHNMQTLPPIRDVVPIKEQFDLQDINLASKTWLTSEESQLWLSTRFANSTYAAACTMLL